MPGWKREDVAYSATGCSSIRQVVPDGFADDLFVRRLQTGATAAEHEWGRRGEINVVASVIDSVGRAVVSGGDADGYTHGRGRLKSLVEVGHGLGGPVDLANLLL